MTPVSTGPDVPIPPKWRRELRLLRRDGIVKYLRTLRAYRRFQKRVRAREQGR